MYAVLFVLKERLDVRYLQYQYIAPVKVILLCPCHFQ